MGQLWSGRRRMINLLLDVDPDHSLAFTLEAARERGYQRLRGWRGRIRAVKWAWGAKPPRVQKSAVGVSR